MWQWLNGRKTYIVAAAIVAYEVLGYLLEGKPVNANNVLEGAGLAALRRGLQSNS